MDATFDVKLHQFIENNNIFDNFADAVKDFFKEHPLAHKIALVANHIFRALAMSALCLALPFAPAANIGICFAGSLFYRLTVENNCPFKFALPAFAGSLAIPLGVQAILDFVSHVAFASLDTFIKTTGALVSLFAYTSYVLLTVNYDVNNHEYNCDSCA